MSGRRGKDCMKAPNTTIGDNTSVEEGVIAQEDGCYLTRQFEGHEHLFEPRIEPGTVDHTHTRVGRLYCHDFPLRGWHSDLKRCHYPHIMYEDMIVRAMGRDLI